MSTRTGFSLFRKKKDKKDKVDSPIVEANFDSTNINKGNKHNEDTIIVREMSDQRFQQLLDESRRLKSEWIDKGSEETEINLWPILKKEKNILQLSNQLHPNKNQLKRLGTDIYSIQIIPPAINSLESLVDSILHVRDISFSKEELASASNLSTQNTICDSSYCSNITSVMTNLERKESIKLEESKLKSCPEGISIDANQEVNQANIDYQQFLEWLKLASNHEFYTRVKKFINSINDMKPAETSSERERQSEMLNLSIRSFVREIMSPVILTNEKKELYSYFLRRFISIMCYQNMLCCLPGYKKDKEDYLLKRSKALSQFITFASLGHDNRHTVAQYKEFWNCAIEQLQVMPIYRFVDDKVICLKNAINILTRLLETIFGVAGADELMDGICLVVMKAQVPQLKLQLQLMDYYYEESEENRGAFESSKLRIQGIISFLKTCKITDFSNVNQFIWEKYMGKEGEGLSRPRTLSQLSSDEIMESYTEKQESDNEEESIQGSIRSSSSFVKLPFFGKKTKKIIDGKWRECLDPEPKWTESERTNDELTVEKRWKDERYRFYKEEPSSPEEQHMMYEEYRNAVKTIENLLYLLRS